MISAKNDPFSKGSFVFLHKGVCPVMALCCPPLGGEIIS